jgi:diguanylate cyclase
LQEYLERTGVFVVHYWEQPGHARKLSDRALELMRDYAVLPTPSNYELWFNYAHGTNDELIKALDTAVANGKIADHAFMHEMHVRFFGSLRTAEVNDMGAKLHEEVQKSKGAIERAVKDVATHGKLLTDTALQLAQGSAGDAKAAAERIASAARALQTTHSTLENHLDHAEREMENLRQRSESVSAESRLDPLTGLFSRKSFDERLEPMAQESLYNNAPLCILIADVDNFRKFNDTWGHATGDHVLRLVAQCLRTNTREQDTPARFGGEEFAVALPNATLQSATAVAEKIRQTVESRKIVKRSTGETLGSITLSLGVAQNAPGEPIAETVRRAVANLGAAKQGGRNRVGTGRDVTTKAARA